MAVSVFGLAVIQLAPFLQQNRFATRIADVSLVEPRDAVGAEMAVIVAQLAPCDDDAGAVEKAEREGPDRPFARAAAFVLIGNRKLALLADSEANGGEMRIAGDNLISGPTRRLVASSCSRKSFGRTLAIFASAFSAALPSGPPARRETQREPSTSASSSSSENISGGSMKPGFRM